MSTYEKLGQYAATELPIAPSNLAITAAYSTSADLEWTNNNGTSGVIIAQLWMGNYWLTKNQFDISATSGTITELPSGEAWRIRIAVLLDGVIYPSAPVVNELPPIVLPTNLTYVGNDNNFVSTITWDGNDSSWENILIRALIYPLTTTGVQSWTTIATLTDTGATSYGISGYTFGEYKMISVGVTIGGEAITQDDTVQTEINKICIGIEDRLFIGGTALDEYWVSWQESGDGAREVNRSNFNNYYFSAWDPQEGEGSPPIALLNYAGTFTIRTNKQESDSRPMHYELTPADFQILNGVQDNGDGTFKLSCAPSSIDAYKIKINLANNSGRYIIVQPFNG